MTNADATAAWIAALEMADDLDLADLIDITEMGLE